MCEHCKFLAKNKNWVVCNKNQKEFVHLYFLMGEVGCLGFERKEDEM